MAKQSKNTVNARLESLEKAVVGLTAMVLLTLNIMMGLLVSTNYNSVRQPRKFGGTSLATSSGG